MSHLFIFVKGGRTNASLWNVYSRAKIWVPGSPGTLRRICCAVFFLASEEEMTGVGISLSVAGFSKEPNGDGLLTFHGIHPFMFRTGKKGEGKQKKTKAQTNSVTAYLSRTTFRIEVFVISLFQK